LLTASPSCMKVKSSVSSPEHAGHRPGFDDGRCQEDVLDNRTKIVVSPPVSIALKYRLC
jgi:hypothetical protein